MIPGAPLFFLAALAAAIPVVLHMISRQRAKHLPFSTLRFLRVSVEKTRRRRRIQDLFLMLLRAAVLVFVALGLSEIKVTQLSALLGRGRTSAVAVVLDNSASMAVMDKGRPRFETARAAVDQILQELKPEDQVALFLTGGPPFAEQGQLDSSRDAFLRMFNQCAVSNQRADLGVRIAQARKVLAASDAPNKVIYVVTDMQKQAWEGTRGEGRGARDEKPEPSPLTPRPSSLAPVVIVDCAREPQPNVAIQNVEPETAVPVAGVPVRANVEVFNAGPGAAQRLVELYVDDRKVATSPVLYVEQEGKRSHPFRFTFDSGGSHRCEARLVGEDASPLDDRWFFTMEVDQGIPVAIVTPQRHEIPYLDDSFYVQQALMPAKAANWAIRGTVLEAKDLATAKLQDYVVIYCVNLPAPEGEVVDKLRQYVEGGGHLFWICGENVQPAAYNAMNQKAEGQLLPCPLLEVRTAQRLGAGDGGRGTGDGKERGRGGEGEKGRDDDSASVVKRSPPLPASSRDSWHIAFLDEKDRALAPLVRPVPLYQSVLIYKYVAQDAGGGKAESGERKAEADSNTPAASGSPSPAPSPPPPDVLARLDEAGEPLLVRRKTGRGSVTMLGTSAHVGWTNLPLRTVFLPLLVRMTFELAGTEQTLRTTLAGSPLVLPLPEEANPVSVSVVPPSGTPYQLQLKTTSEPGQPGQILRYEDTYAVGFYTMRPLAGTGTRQIAFAVNADPDEANPSKADRDEVRQRFAPADVLFADDPEDLSGTFKLLHEGTNLWDYFLWSVLIILVFETFVSNWLSPKPADEELQRVPPGMRRMGRQKARNLKPQIPDLKS